MPMSAGNEKRQRKRSTRVRRGGKVPATNASTVAAEGEPTDEAAREHYRREKERRAQRVRPPEHPLEQARRTYHALLAADAERAKGGRPKKDGAPVPPAPVIKADAEAETEE
jgi:hypothetical protein